MSVEGVPENNVHEIRYDEECIMRQYQLSMDRFISVEIIAFKTRA